MRPTLGSLTGGLREDLALGLRSVVVRVIELGVVVGMLFGGSFAHGLTVPLGGAEM